jgi:hypothetical protein
MRSKELVETALHVLVAWSDRRTPAPADLAALRNALPSLADLPPDDLACEVIHMFGRTFAKRELGDAAIDDVA